MKMIINLHNGMSDMSALHIQNLSKKFGQQNAVYDTSWQAKRGEIVCLLGHSGCGKTTMLRLIAGLESPSAGQIMFGDRILWSNTHHVAAEHRNIGLVFQDYALFPHLNVFENIKFGLNHFKREQQKQIADDVLKHVSLSQHATKYPHMLSGGEQQRIALARALAPKPDVLLMDEPFSNLDRRLRDRIRQDTLSILRDLGTTTIIVTHDPEEALHIADQIILMHEGQIIQSGTPQQLYETPNSLFAAEYFSAINQIPCVVNHNVLKSACGQLEFKSINPEQRVDQSTSPNANYLYCFRPYHVTLSVEPQNQDSIPVTVTSSDYLGHQMLVKVQIHSTSYIIHAQGIFHCPTHVGQAFFMCIQPQQSFIFAKDSATP